MLPTLAPSASMESMWGALTFILQAFKIENEGVRGAQLVNRLTSEAGAASNDIGPWWGSLTPGLDDVLETAPFAGNLHFESMETWQWDRSVFGVRFFIKRVASLALDKGGVFGAVVSASARLDIVVLAIPSSPYNEYIYFVYQNPDRSISDIPVLSHYSNEDDVVEYLLGLDLTPGIVSAKADSPPFFATMYSSLLQHRDRRALPYSGVDPEEWRMKKTKVEIPVPPRTFKCSICLEDCNRDDYRKFRDCDHQFCEPCLQTYVRTALKDGVFPVHCPVCVIETSANPPKSIVTLQMMDTLHLRQEQTKWHELSKLKTHIRMDCPKCSQSVFVPRRKGIPLISTFSCPEKGCRQRLCRKCLGPVKLLNIRHRCPGLKELKVLMKDRGWRPCPGCGTPTERIDGCNHMRCTVHGCKTHWSYVTGRSKWWLNALDRLDDWLN